MSRGRRYDDTPKLNIKKVIATIVAIIVLIMVVISIKRLLTSKPKTKDVTTAETFFSVYENGKWGVIDNTGNYVVNATYDEMIVIPDKNTDLFICTYDVDYQNETYNTKVINKSNSSVLTNYQNVEAIENSNVSEVWYESDILKFQKDGKYGLIDFKGKMILDAEYDKIYALPGVKKNLIIEKGGKKGLVNTSMGEIIINPVYDEVTTLSDSYENGYIVTANGKYGLINADAKVIFEPVFDEIKHTSSNEYYAVVKDGKLQVINGAGEAKLTEGFDQIVDINGDNVTLVINGVYGAEKIDGIVVIEPQYEDLKYIFGTYYIAKKDGHYGVVSTTGENPIPFSYNTMSYIKKADFIEADDESLNTDIFDRNFNMVLEDVIVSDLNLDDGYMRIRKDDEYQYYNFKFEPKTNIDVFTTNTLFLVKENGKYGYVNKNNEKIVDCIYDDAKEQNSYGYCAVKKDGLWGCLKSDGTVIVEPSVNLDENLIIDFIEKWHLDKELDLNMYTK